MRSWFMSKWVRWSSVIMMVTSPTAAFHLSSHATRFHPAGQMSPMLQQREYCIACCQADGGCSCESIRQEPMSTPVKAMIIQHPAGAQSKSQVARRQRCVHGKHGKLRKSNSARGRLSRSGQIKAGLPGEPDDDTDEPPIPFARDLIFILNSPLGLLVFLALTSQLAPHHVATSMADFGAIPLEELGEL